MLDIVPSTSSRPRTMMSVDLTPYLLSASPPSAGFCFQSLSLSSSYTPYSFFSSTSTSRESSVRRTTVYGKACTHSSPLKSIMSVKSNKDDDCQSQLAQNTDASSEGQSTSASVCEGKKMKRVSFADHVGMPLVEVRLMLEKSADPPKFSREQLNEITGGHMDAELTMDNDSVNPPLIVSFPQPLTRQNFNEELRKKMVAVENVIVDGYMVTCTIFVNKHPTVKRVFGRYTLDSWQSHQDITALYCTSLRMDHDTYQFKIQVPLSADRTKSIQFAVCYEADGVQHWDNNDGDNYTIEWSQAPEQEPEENSKDNDNGNPIAFGGMSWWCDDSDLSRPYY